VSEAEIPLAFVRDLHQIEITSRCNLRCKYCVHPTMERAKEDMTWETFKKAIHWVSVFSGWGTQVELNLAGIGESTMHPDFVEMVHYAAAELPTIHLVLATNGLLMTEELAHAIKDTGINVFVSLHRPEKAARAVEALRSAGIFNGVSTDPATAATDWAGQVKWVRSMAPRDCMWVRGGKVFCMSDGSIKPCSLDGRRGEILGTVWDDVSNMTTHPYSLCMTCDQKLGIPDWNQETATDERSHDVSQ